MKFLQNEIERSDFKLSDPKLSLLYCTEITLIVTALLILITKNHNNEQIQVQKYSATLKMYNSVLQAIPGALYLLIAGPLSDVYGDNYVPQ